MEIAHQPKWETWLNFPFYEEKCTIHPKKYNTVYCGACMERPVCTRCWKSYQDHAHHQPVLKVRVASNKAAIAVKDIREFLDISEIQVYKINNKNIVFLNPHGRPKEDPTNPTCLTCFRRLMKLDHENQYKFCCIACKIESKEDDMKKIEQEMIVRERPRIILKLKLKRKNEESSSSSSSSSSPSPSPSLSFRKRSRKGIPHRSPLQ